LLELAELLFEGHLREQCFDPLFEVGRRLGDGRPVVDGDGRNRAQRGDQPYSAGRDFGPANRNVRPAALRPHLHAPVQNV
jgi:hypothetical protein